MFDCDISFSMYFLKLQVSEFAFVGFDHWKTKKYKSRFSLSHFHLQIICNFQWGTNFKHTL